MEMEMEMEMEMGMGTGMEMEAGRRGRKSYAEDAKKKIQKIPKKDLENSIKT
jgi:hypothetical protein